MAKEKELEKDVDLSTEVEKIVKEKENVSYETNEKSDLNQKIDKIGADLKNIVDKIDSFEVDTDEILENVSRETNEKNEDKKGVIALVVVFLIIIAFVFKDKIANEIQKRQNS